jgi:hypothetical protein
MFKHIYLKEEKSFSLVSKENKSFKTLFLTNLGTTPTLHSHKHVSLSISMAPFYFVQGLLLFLCLMLNIMNYYLMELLFSFHILFQYTIYALEPAAILICKYCIHLWVNKLQSSCNFITFMLEDEHRLSLGMLMHVKCIHEIFSLLGHISSYLIVLWGPELVCHWFQGFSKQSPIIWF